MKPWIIGTLTILTILLCMYVLGCQRQLYTPATYSGKQIIFGNGGGFTGAETEYILLDNGQLFSKRDKAKEPEAARTLPKAITTQLFDKALQLSSTPIEFNHPGNIYYFIQLPDTKPTKRITWGNQQHHVPEEIENLYQLLMVSIND